MRRPRGWSEVAELIRQRTNGYDELVEFALAVMRDSKTATVDRLKAHQWLSDRGMGRAALNVELHAELSRADAPSLDLSKLSDDELRAFVSLAQKAKVDMDGTRELELALEVEGEE